MSSIKEHVHYINRHLSFESQPYFIAEISEKLLLAAKRPEGETDEPFIDFEDEDNDQTIEDIKKKQDAEFDITAKHFTAAEEKKKKEKQGKSQGRELVYNHFIEQ